MSRAGIRGPAVGRWLGLVWDAWGFGEMALVGLVGLLGFLTAPALTHGRVLAGLAGCAAGRRRPQGAQGRNG